MERKPEQISRDIAAFERKLSEAGSNEVLIEALNKKLTKLKNELKGGQISTRQLASNLLGARKKVREMAAKDFRELISRLSRKPEYYFLKKYTKSQIKDDLSRPAKPVGYRFKGIGNYEVPSKTQIKKGLADGTVYSERRPNRSDVSRVAQLAKGGSVTTKTGKMKMYFKELLISAQKQGKFKDVVQFLDNEYGVWFTDNSKITPEELQTKINRSDFSSMSISDLKDIEKDVKNIISRK